MISIMCYCRSPYRLKSAKQRERLLPSPSGTSGAPASDLLPLLKCNPSVRATLACPKRSYTCLRAALPRAVSVVQVEPILRARRRESRLYTAPSMTRELLLDLPTPTRLDCTRPGRSADKEEKGESCLLGREGGGGKNRRVKRFRERNEPGFSC